MAELTITQIIKIIIGIVVFVIVVGGVAFFFKERVVGFFDNSVGGNLSNLILNLFRLK